jgi:hypothetical protein
MTKAPRNADEAFAMEMDVSPKTAAKYRQRLGASGSYHELDATLKAEAALADLDAVRSIDEDDVEDLAEEPDPMAALTDLVGERAEVRLRAQLAAHSSWAKTEDPTARTRPAREAFIARFEREVDPEGKLPVAERVKRAQHAHKAHMLRMSLASAKARRERKS